MSSDRVLGLHATPLPPGGKVPPGRHHPAPGSCYDTSRLLATPFGCALHDFPRGVLDSHRFAFTSRCSAPFRPDGFVQAVHLSRMPGLHSTPVALARQRCLAAFRHIQASRLSERARGSSGFLGTGRFSSPSIASCEAPDGDRALTSTRALSGQLQVISRL